MRRVVVSGIGAVTPLATTFCSSWTSLLLKLSGVRPLLEADTIQELDDFEIDRLRSLSCQVVAPVQDYISIESNRNTPRFAQFALSAAREALLDIPIDTLDKERIGVSIGCGMSGAQEIVATCQSIEYTKRLRVKSPHFIPKILGNSASGRVSMEYRLLGPNLTASTACAAGAHALGDAYRCIQTGMADMMLAGGTETCIDPLSIAGFARMRALSTKFNEEPRKASRPFDEQRDGFVMGEGACVILLEEWEQARERLGAGARVVELVGYGAAGDAHHPTSPDPEGGGAERAMKMALREAKLDFVDYVNAHATSTPKGDQIEAEAISRTFQDKRVPYVSSTKGATGHLLGAAGAIESAFAIKALQEQEIPHTLNLETPVSVKGISFVREEPLKTTINTAMSNSFGFGGTNACLAFRRTRL